MSEHSEATFSADRHWLWMRLHGLAAVADGLLMILTGRDFGVQLKSAVYEIQRGKRG